MAHELRTPIAELRALADVALKWDGDRETSLGYFKDAQDVARQMERIVTTLLSLARCQSGTMTVVREGVNLGDLIREVWDGHRQAAAERHLAVTFDVAGQMVIETDRTMLHSIVSNLLANAAQYARVGGTVACRAVANGSGLKLTVTNDVDCLSPDDLPHMLEAFWRKDAARTDGSHCGLGLTLVAAYAAALGGKIEVSLLQHDTLCAALDLPCVDVSERIAAYDRPFRQEGTYCPAGRMSAAKSPRVAPGPWPAAGCVPAAPIGTEGSALAPPKAGAIPAPCAGAAAEP